jgi:hypothetical protein
LAVIKNSFATLGFTGLYICLEIFGIAFTAFAVILVEILLLIFGDSFTLRVAEKASVSVLIF